MKKVLDNGGSCSALLVDLSKAFSCVVHDLLLAKVSTYDFDHNSLKPINSLPSDEIFRTKIGSSYSPNLNLLVSVSQGSILGPLLFNIYMCHLFLCDCNSSIINYVDNTTLYACEPNMGLVLTKLEKDTSTVFTRFQNTNLKANSRKSHLLTTSVIVLHINVAGNEELLGLLRDHKLTFETHLLNIFQKINQKNISVHASEKAENYHESICLFTVCILPTNLDFTILRTS